MKTTILSRGSFLKQTKNPSLTLPLALLGGVFALMLFFLGDLSSTGLSLTLGAFFLVAIAMMARNYFEQASYFCGDFELHKKNGENIPFLSYQLKITLPHIYRSQLMDFAIEIIYKDGPKTSIEKKFFSGAIRNELFADFQASGVPVKIIFYDRKHHRSEECVLVSD